MVKCDLTHNIIVFLKRVKVNSFKEFFSKKQKAFNSEIKHRLAIRLIDVFRIILFIFLFVCKNKT